jgi:DNA-binding transcriptional regulator GbsR (MarR family)
LKKLATYNTLPPRQEYILLVKKALSQRELSLGSLVKTTKLTKTQVACTLDMLITENIISENKIDSKVYYTMNEAPPLGENT